VLALPAGKHSSVRPGTEAFLSHCHDRRCYRVRMLSTNWLAADNRISIGGGHPVQPLDTAGWTNPSSAPS